MEIEEISQNEILVRGDTKNSFVGELVKIELYSGEVVQGEVKAVFENQLIVFVSGSLRGVGKDDNIRFLGKEVTVPVSPGMLNKFLDIAEFEYGLKNELFTQELSLRSQARNPIMRVPLSNQFFTGNPAIDLLTPLVYGQKMGIFSSEAFLYNQFCEFCMRVLNNSKDLVIFTFIGLSQSLLIKYKTFLEGKGLNFIFVYSLDTAPIEVLFNTPHFGLRIAEYFSHELGQNVLCLLGDMTYYMQLVRESRLVLNELPGRKGYPVDMFSSLASFYERAGVFKGVPGSLSIMCYSRIIAEDYEHPIVDTTGFITEGQLYFSNASAVVNPSFPLEVQGSLSRMASEVGDKNFEGHMAASNFFFESYLQGLEVQKIEKIVGTSVLTSEQTAYLDFKTFFDENFISYEGSINSSQLPNLVSQGLRLLPEYKIPLKLRNIFL